MPASKLGQQGMMSKKVAIIGAGASGLTAIKSCLEEGLEPTCFERSTDIGGLWRFTHDIEEGRGSIYSSVATNTSKEMMSYSDFPMPNDFPVYPHHSKILEYLQLYTEHFNLRKHIQLNTEVCSVMKNSDFDTTGQWNIVTEKNGIKELATFDAVIVCSGHFSDPYLPLNSFPGIELFKGRYIHSRFYKTPENYLGKTVLIVGAGNSAGDIAAEISFTAKQVFLSTRQGTWIVSRISHNGFPIDMVLLRRWTTWLKNLLPFALSAKLNAKIFGRWFDHSNYGLEPKNRLKNPVVNDYLPCQILHGLIKVKPKIKEIKETSVIFEDNTETGRLDEIIFATGYNATFPFIDDPVMKLNENPVSMYKNVFPINLAKPTMAFLGLIQPLGSILPTTEIQARWAARVFKGAVQLPSTGMMEAYAIKSKKKKEKWFGSGKAQIFQAHYIEYIDEVSKEIGNHPKILSLFFTDPRLALKIFFGPCTSYQYRLTGPGKWHGAREAILTQWDRTLNATRTRVIFKNHGTRSVLPTLLVFCTLTAAVYLGYKQLSFKKKNCNQYFSMIK
ncbi:dimethylaniline monooxygenase [N-oxide-forming] 2 [Pelobates cultripes]|uniref:Flavin-containing monooxygenase n=1 Tax=Pelobates cultripes TaxID=61616 RepID=A0AAD1WKS5_PELCU|nr:dimethylaniline monooxygenase [N-oxide-forming] 2 [Pelobates cultripes]